jgi:hypothetical protein
MNYEKNKTKNQFNPMKKVLSFCLFVLIIVRCSKDSAPVDMAGEQPASALVASGIISTAKYNAASTVSAMGYEFKTKADGHVTGMGCSSASIGNFALALYKVDSVNKTGSLIASLPIAISASDTANFKFKYGFLSSKVAISKGVYYRVVLAGNFTAYNYMYFRIGSTYKIPVALPTDTKFVFTKGVTGVSSLYPDSEYSGFLFPADVVVQFP